MRRLSNSRQVGAACAARLCRAAGAACQVMVLFLLVLAASQAQAVTINWVPIGNPNNADDTEGAGYGGVAYNYWISKYEVTNSQYVEFLNAKDPSGGNALGLYNSNMNDDARGGITYTAGNANGSKYAVKSGRDIQPVVFVSWYDSIRFANWLNNGQGNGDTETGAYTLLGGTATPSNGNSITRNAGAKVFLTSEDEWYKAAYNQPNTNTYFDYPTGTNAEPNSDHPTGAVANAANFYRNTGDAGYNDGFAVTGSTIYSSSQNYLTDVGAYTGSPSLYGTFDQGGNVWEWSEALISDSYRGVRGGSWGSISSFLLASYRDYYVATFESQTVGFRVAMIPEPTSLTQAAIGVLGLLHRRRRKR